MYRRELLGATVGATVTFTAGCLGNGDDTTTSDRPDGDPDAVVEEYYELSANIETVEEYEQFTDAVKGLLHSESPIRDALEQTPTQEELDEEEAELEGVQTAVIEEHLDADAIDEQFQLAQFIPDEAEREATREQLTTANAHIEATLEISVPDVENEELVENWLVVAEADEWRVFI